MALFDGIPAAIQAYRDDLELLSEEEQYNEGFRMLWEAMLGLAYDFTDWQDGYVPMVSGDALIFVDPGSGGLGDMTKGVYDTNDDGRVDAADHATAADSATTAGDADTVDGQHAAAFEAAGAVGTHEGTYAHANLPSAGEKAALPGTSGVPGAGNKYVTDSDPRNSDARTPTAHTHPGGEITSQVASAAAADAAPWSGITSKPAVLGGDLVFRLATSQLVSHDVGAPLAHGQFALNAGAYASGTWTFRMVGWVSGPTTPLTARARLYNLTDSEYVTDADVTTTAVVVTKVVSAALTVGNAAGNLQGTEKIYEIRMEIENGVWNTDTAHFGSVELVRT